MKSAIGKFITQTQVTGKQKYELINRESRLSDCQKIVYRLIARRKINSAQDGVKTKANESGTQLGKIKGQRCTHDKASKETGYPGTRSCSGRRSAKLEAGVVAAATPAATEAAPQIQWLYM